MSTIADTELAFAGPAALAAQVRAREVSPRELVELYLRRIEELNPRLNAFRTVLAEEALAEADDRAGHDGPLAGVPIAIKDDLAVAGQVATTRLAQLRAAGRGRRRGRAPPARGRGDPDRHHHHPRAVHLPVDGDARPTGSPATRGTPSAPRAARPEGRRRPSPPDWWPRPRDRTAADRSAFPRLATAWWA